MTSLASIDTADRALFAKLRPLVIAVASLLFLLSVAGVLLMLRGAESGHVDFRTFYTVGYIVRTGHASQLYDFEEYSTLQNQLVGPADETLPFNHLAYESLLYVPFSLLSYRHAYLAFLATNLIVLAVSIWMLRSVLSPLANLWIYLPWAFVLCFLPVAMAIIEGQDSLFLLALFIAASTAMQRQKDFRAGVLVGLTLFKFQYALPIALLFLIWRRWRFLAGFAASSAVVLSLSGWLIGWSGIISYFHSVMEISSRFSTTKAVLYGVHPEGMPNLRGLASVISGSSVSEAHLITFVLSVLVLVWAAFKPPSLSGALLAALLVSYHQVIADTTLVLLPLGFYLARAVTTFGPQRRQMAAIGLLTFLAPTVLLFVGTRFYLTVLPILGLFMVFNGARTSPNFGLKAP